MGVQINNGRNRTIVIASTSVLAVLLALLIASTLYYSATLLYRHATGSEGSGSWIPGFIGLVLDLSMIIGATVGYIAQCRSIIVLRSSQGFSLLIPAILLSSNTLRCLWWFGNHYSTALLIQAVIQIGVQLVLLYLAVKYRSKTGGEGKKPTESVWMYKLRHFWAWDSFSDFFYVYAVFAAFFFVLTVSITGTRLPFAPAYIAWLGYSSMLIEATIAMPQIFRNFRKKSTRGLSAIMIGAWLFGDTYKLFYYIIAAQPAPFIVCAVIQLVDDLIVVYQMRAYKTVMSPVVESKV
ncbi:PQ loop repeat [Carpediemonas membranifera]|uniref:PQ loop repeat n=1 Tax=Carpediemonas membranifera TaxID=201153 RepID=A0A8J6E6Q8_9EUKA|nr:PQ loop repeat [Carpediemonas membranifera]|eukprot:KAG9397387.1 PQ loop repeat [Carpediemonas membranifera]